MLTEARRRLILERLRRDGNVVAAELSSSLDVSVSRCAATCVSFPRPDCCAACMVGRCRRRSARAVFGAARAGSEGQGRDCTCDESSGSPGQVILLYSGTTTLEVARHLPPDLEATVITNSPPIAVALADHASVEVMVLGGMLAKGAHSLVGAATIEALRSVRADLLVLGVCSVHPEFGITVVELEESYVKRLMIANAAEVVAVSSAEELGSAGPFVIAPLEELTYLVTEESASVEQLDDYRAAGVEVVLA